MNYSSETLVGKSKAGTERPSPSQSYGVSELSGSPTNLYAVDKLLKDELMVIKLQEREEGLDSGEVRGLLETFKIELDATIFTITKISDFYILLLKSTWLK